MNRQSLTRFEDIVRRSSHYHADESVISLHPFELRDIDQSLPVEVKLLFDNGHYAQATFEAYKFLDNKVKDISGIDKTGKALMMEAFKEVSPAITLGDLGKESGRNEQEGFKFLFAGSMIGIRNPRGHEYSIKDDQNTCLDHLSLVSLLIRRLKVAGYL